MNSVRSGRPAGGLLPGVLIFSGLALLLAGCGSSENPRMPVTGAVQFDGKPVDGGVIRFLAQDEKNVHTNAAIRAGKYELTDKDGPNVGKYKVQISWPKKTGRKINTSETGDAEYVQEETVERIPAKYNATHTTLEADVKSGKNNFDFDLKK